MTDPSSQPQFADPSSPEAALSRAPPQNLAQPSVADDVAEKPRRSPWHPVQLACWVFVGVAALVIFVEMRAWYCRNKSLDAVEAAMEEVRSTRPTVQNKHRAVISHEMLQTQGLLRGDYTAEPATYRPGIASQRFTWHGVFRPHRFDVYYSPDGNVQRVTDE